MRNYPSGGTFVRDDIVELGSSPTASTGLPDSCFDHLYCRLFGPTSIGGGRRGTWMKNFTDLDRLKVDVRVADTLQAGLRIGAYPDGKLGLKQEE